MSFAAEHRLFGLNPLPYHIDNLALHLINTALAAWLIHLLSGSVLAALAGATLFGIHPLHVASVAWVTERKDVLYAIFFLGSIISYLYYRQRKQDRLYYLSLALFALSLLSKPMAVTLPAVLILTDYLRKETFSAKRISGYVPYAALAGIFTIVTLVARSIGKEPEYTFIDNVFIANYAFVFYLVKTVLPVKLACYYPPPAKTGALLPVIFYCAPLAVAALAAAVAFSARYTRKIVFGFLFYAVTVFPVLHLVSGGPTVGDHYTYIPLLGIFYLAGEGVSRLWERRQKARGLIAAGLAVLTIALAGATWTRCLVWKDGLTLWNDFLSKYGGMPNTSIAYSNRGNAHMDAGDIGKAVADYDEAVRLDPLYADGYNNRGNAYNMLKEYDRAIADYNRVLEIRPAHAEAHYNRGNSYIYKGDYQQAMADYAAAIQINPNYAEAYNNLGNALSDTGSPEKSIAFYDAALRINPGFAEAYANRGNALTRMGALGRAIADYTNAIRCNPRYAAAYLGRANAQAAAGKYREALRDIAAAQQLGSAVDPAVIEELRRRSTGLSPL